MFSWTHTLPQIYWLISLLHCESLKQKLYNFVFLVFSHVFITNTVDCLKWWSQGQNSWCNLSITSCSTKLQCIKLWTNITLETVTRGQCTWWNQLRLMVESTCLGVDWLVSMVWLVLCTANPCTKDMAKRP